MITKITSIEELTKMFTKVLLSKTDKVTKVSGDSVLGGVSYGIGKIAQKALKDIALVETHQFPELANGEALDVIASRRGVPGRLGASGSSVYLRLVAEPGTEYLQATHIFRGSGIDFQLEGDITIGNAGYTFVRGRSIQEGKSTNVNSLLIDSMNTEPEGHISVLNEFRAQGGRDIEDDEMFRHRIINYPNIMARNTLAFLTQRLLEFNPNIFRVYKRGVTADGKLLLGVILQNGSFLTQNELNTLTTQITPYLSLNQVAPNGTALIQLENCNYLPIDIIFRVKISSNANLSQVRIDLQNKISKYLDLRFWDNRVVQWEYILNIISSHKDVLLLPEQHFSPRTDIITYLGEYPRIRSFKMYTLTGDLLSENTNSYEPVLFTDNIRYE